MTRQITARPVATHAAPKALLAAHAVHSTPIDMNDAKVHAAVQRKCDAFFKTAHRPVQAPLNPDRFAHCNVTPKFEMGVGREAYNINGQLYVKVTTVTPNPTPAWYEVGKMPVVK